MTAAAHILFDHDGCGPAVADLPGVPGLGHGDVVAAFSRGINPYCLVCANACKTHCRGYGGLARPLCWGEPASLFRAETPARGVSPGSAGMPSGAGDLVSLAGSDQAAPDVPPRVGPALCEQSADGACIAGGGDAPMAPEDASEGRDVSSADGLMRVGGVPLPGSAVIRPSGAIHAGAFPAGTTIPLPPEFGGEIPLDG